MSELGQVLEVMHTSSESCHSLRLEGHEWRHRETFSRAWKHHLDELRRCGAASVRSFAFKKGGEGEPAPESREIWRVWLAKPDKRRAEFQVGDDMVTAVFAGQRWWSKSPNGFRTNEGALNSGHGFGPGAALIDPAAYLAVLQLSVDSRTTFLSRPAFVVTAIPRAIDPHEFNATFHMLGTGADLYQLVIDAELGILLRSEADFRGDAFRVIEVDAIGVDEQFSEATFDGERLRNVE